LGVECGRQAQSEEYGEKLNSILNCPNYGIRYDRKTISMKHDEYKKHTTSHPPWRCQVTCGLVGLVQTVNDDLNALCSLSDLKQQSEITSTVQQRVKQKCLETSSDPVDLMLFHKP
jgi:hypothetical protein